MILLNSKSSRFPNGLGNDNDLLGKYICFHIYRGHASGKIGGFEDKYYYGKNPTEPILANYRNLKDQETGKEETIDKNKLYNYIMTALMTPSSSCSGCDESIFCNHCATSHYGNANQTVGIHRRI